MPKFILITLLSALTFPVLSQTKQISFQSLPGVTGLSFGAEMDQAGSMITMTIQGPDDRWFAIGFGVSMANGDILTYTDGKVGAMHSLDVWDYVLTAQNANGVSKDGQQDWSVVSNTTAGGLRTIVATRSLSTGDANDIALNYADASVNVIYAKSDNADFTLAYHGTNRGTTTLNWVELDLTAPALTATPFDPVDDATGVTLGTNLTMNFDENVVAGTGNITLKLVSNNSIVEQFDVASSSAVTFSGNSVIINPTNNFNAITEYYVTVDTGAIQDGSGNSYSGFSDNASWNFTTLDNTGDVTAPDLAVGPFIPADDATGVPLSTDLMVTFNEDVLFGSGNIIIRENTGGTIFESFDVSTSTSLAVNGSTMTITPNSDFALNTTYNVEIDNGAIEDLAGNTFAGFTDQQTWNFTTTDVDGIQELNNSSFDVKISSQKVTIVSQNMSAFSYNLHLLNGQLIHSGNCSNGAVTIPVNDSSKTLIIKIESEGKSYVGKYALN